jgi:hypothetical protein
MLESISSFDNGSIDLKVLLDELKNGSAALEGLRSEYVDEVRGILARLRIAQFTEEDNFISDKKNIIEEFKAWLSKVSNDA